MVFAGGAIVTQCCLLVGVLCSFQCMSENHYPASCADVEAWIAKESDEGETVKWMQAHNVKKCPNCKALVEKIDGWCVVFSFLLFFYWAENVS